MNERILYGWLKQKMGENPVSWSLEVDSEDIRDMGWNSGIFGDSVAVMKIYPEIEPHEILKEYWKNKGAPDEDVNKMGVLLVRFAWEWGHSKIYVYPLGCVE